MWDIYPRPQLVRNSYFNLNGEWLFAEQPADNPVLPPKYNEVIQVPFVAESPASGLDRLIPEENMVCYKKTFVLPKDFIPEGYRLKLNFGAVDQVYRIIFNGEEIGSFDNGYIHYSCIVPSRLIEFENTLEVYVWDTLDDLVRPRGKQRHKAGGMWYTPVTGIWQTVWMEAVPAYYIDDLKIDVTLDSADIKVFVKDAETGERVTDFNGTIKLNTVPKLGLDLHQEAKEKTADSKKDNKKEKKEKKDKKHGKIQSSIILPIEDGKCHIEFLEPKHWTPEEPYIYEFSVSIENDTIESYLGLRTLRVDNVKGVPRILLNEKPYFFHGVLDQGYFKEGIFTPLSPEDYDKDILTMKALGFNTLRKHIKVEPDHFYYLCDRLGMIVFQDMVNNGEYKYLRDTIMPTLIQNKGKSDLKMNPDPVTQKAFLKGAQATVKQLYNHPSIALWTIFNEGWGQFTGDKVCAMFREWDSSRIIDTASGWYICENSDVTSPHVYFWHVTLKPDTKPIVLSEYGGYTYAVPGHTWKSDQTYGYKDFKNQGEFEKQLIKLLKTQVLPYIKDGLCSDIYTQLSDVEEELNGLMTYDREIVKVSKSKLKKIGDRLQKEMKKYS